MIRCDDRRRDCRQNRQISRAALDAVAAARTTDAQGTRGRSRLPLVVWVVTAGTFLMATSEFLVAGVLPEVAHAFRIDVGSAGLATLHELGNALDRFRAAGKDVVAVVGDTGQAQYLLASHADKILLDPYGSVMLEGLANYRSYFKDALDKLGVEVHMIKVGQYKSAAEPYVLNGPSDA